MRKKQRDTLSRSAMKLLCTLLGIILCLMLAVTWGFHSLLSQISTVSGPTADTPAFSLSTVRQNLEKPKSLSLLSNSRVVNILLIGQDRREGESQARSDSMILCSFCKDTGKLTMTSFLRDLYVPIPGHGSNRINAAYAYGGMHLLEQTIEENFDVAIDGCVEVDFRQFSGIIDLLGGVSLELRQDEANFINQETGSSLTEGTQVLNGDQALTYSRIRSLDADGDFSRTDRQRKVISALLDGCRKADPAALMQLMNRVLPMITTDLNQGQILMLAIQTVPHLSDLQMTSQRIPADGTYSDDTIDGMQVLVADLDQARQLLQNIVN